MKSVKFFRRKGIQAKRRHPFPDYLVGRTLQRRWRINSRLQTSSSEIIHNAVDLYTRKEVSVKTVSPTMTSHFLSHEIEIYKLLQKCKSRQVDGIPRMFDYGYEYQHVFMVLDLLGPSIESVFRGCACKFSNKAIVAIATQVLCRLQTLHSRGIVHGNINPKTLRMGEHEFSSMVYVSDYRSAFPFLNGDQVITIHSSERDAYTAAFESLEVSDGEIPSPKDDLESFGYVLLYLLTGKLPWCEVRSIGKETSIQAIRDYKAITPFDSVCSGLPPELVEYLTYCRCSHPDHAPDYAYLRTIFGQWYLKLNGDYTPPLRWRDTPQMVSPSACTGARSGDKMKYMIPSPFFGRICANSNKMSCFRVRCSKNQTT